MNEAETGIERAQGDYMGMLATVINGMALQAGLEKIGVTKRLQHISYSYTSSITKISRNNKKLFRLMFV